jgi:hypothetical protein
MAKNGDNDNNNNHGGGGGNRGSGGLFDRLLAPLRRGQDHPSSSSAMATEAATTTGVYVPLYVYPYGQGLGDFERVAKACREHPAVRMVVTVNPSSGPGAAVDPVYRTAVSLLQGAGALVLGYVYTSWGNRDAREVAGDIEKYVGWYGVDGVMLDEFATDPALEGRMRAICAYARSKGAGYMVANPGTDIPASFVGAADCYIIYENAGLPSDDWLGGWHASYDKVNWSSCSYGVKALDAKTAGRLARRVGLLYVTDDGLPNPYDSLCSYFEQLVGMLDVRQQPRLRQPKNGQLWRDG